MQKTDWIVLRRGPKLPVWTDIGTLDGACLPNEMRFSTLTKIVVSAVDGSRYACVATSDTEVRDGHIVQIWLVEDLVV